MDERKGSILGLVELGLFCVKTLPLLQTCCSSGVQVAFLTRHNVALVRTNTRVFRKTAQSSTRPWALILDGRLYGAKIYTVPKVIIHKPYCV